MEVARCIKVLAKYDKTRTHSTIFFLAHLRSSINNFSRFHPLIPPLLTPPARVAEWTGLQPFTTVAFLSKVNAYSAERWAKVKKAAEGGMSYRQAEARFRIGFSAIGQRARRRGRRLVERLWSSSLEVEAVVRPVRNGVARWWLNKRMRIFQNYVGCLRRLPAPVADLVSPPFWNLPAPIHKEFCGKSPHPMIVWRSHVQFFSSRTRERVLEQPPDNADKAGFLPTGKSVCPFYGPTICH